MHLSPIEHMLPSSHGPSIALQPSQQSDGKSHTQAASTGTGSMSLDWDIPPADSPAPVKDEPTDGEPGPPQPQMTSANATRTFENPFIGTPMGYTRAEYAITVDSQHVMKTQADSWATWGGLCRMCQTIAAARFPG